MATLVERGIGPDDASGEPRRPAHGDNWLDPVRGIAIGMAIGLLAWTLIGLAIWLFVD